MKPGPYLIDDDAPRNRHKEWWLERYTQEEIRDLGAGIVGALDIQSSAAQAGTCQNEGCNAQFKVRAHNQRFCSDRCRKRASDRTGIWKDAAKARRKARYEELRAVGVPGREAKLLADSPERTEGRLREIRLAAAA